MKYILIILLLSSFSANAQKDTVKAVILVSDTTIHSIGLYGSAAKYIYGYIVREKHSTSENQIDAGGMVCMDGLGNTIPCYSDYYKYIGYLDRNKNPLPSMFLIWDSREVRP